MRALEWTLIVAMALMLVVCGVYIYRVESGADQTHQIERMEVW